jgi:hypothetical protein
MLSCNVVLSSIFCYSYDSPRPSHSGSPTTYSVPKILQISESIEGEILKGKFPGNSRREDFISQNYWQIFPPRNFLSEVNSRISAFVFFIYKMHKEVLRWPAELIPVLPRYMCM